MSRIPFCLNLQFNVTTLSQIAYILKLWVLKFTQNKVENFSCMFWDRIRKMVSLSLVTTWRKMLFFLSCHKHGTKKNSDYIHELHYGPCSPESLWLSDRVSKLQSSKVWSSNPHGEIEFFFSLCLKHLWQDQKRFPLLLYQAQNLPTFLLLTNMAQSTSLILAVWKMHVIHEVCNAPRSP